MGWTKVSTVYLLTVLGAVWAAEPPADDRYAAAVWHCERIADNRTPDDTSTGRAARELRLDYGNPITLTAAGTGAMGGRALNFATDGTRFARAASAWPGQAGDEFRLDGWFYFNSNGLPSATGAATMYVFYISNSGASGIIVEMFVHTNDELRFGYFEDGAGDVKRIAAVKLKDAAAGINLTDKWVRVIATASNDPASRGARLKVIDGENVYENFVAADRTMRVAQRNIYVGHMEGRTTNSPRRGFRGMMDEIKLSIRADEPDFAYGPNPPYGVVIPADSEQALSWRKGRGAISQTVRMGPSATMDNNPIVADGVTGDRVTVHTQPGKTYYWQINTHNDSGISVGDVWRFSTETGRAYAPSPSHNAADVTYPVDTLTLSWAGADGVESYQVYFGTTETPSLLGGTTANQMTTPPLLPYTRYYWRVDSLTADGTITGDLWTFRTRVLAFPGAEGFGRWARGGRGGSVYRVTNLNDSGPGSFRDAVSQPNRYVIFDVGGVIRIQNRVILSRNLTIAGQTAPGDGVVIYGNGVSYSNANDSITRFMRYRMGRVGDSGADGIAVAHGTNMIWDHCSASWGRDENFSIASSGPGANEGHFTIQNCLIALGLHSHSCGSLIEWNNTSIFRSVYIDNHTRNPKVKGVNDFVNNVVYNWRVAGYILGDTAGDSYANIVNNYFVNGPNTGSSAFSRANVNFRLYAANNVQDANRDGVLNGGVIAKSAYGPVSWMDEPFDYPGVQTLLDATTAYKVAASRAGAYLPARDRTDQRLMTELRSVGVLGQIIADENDAPFNGVGPVVGAAPPTDTDGDGMPDYWELAMGLNPLVPDHNGDVTGNGYTNLEDYLNWLAGPHTRVGSGASVTVDLRRYTDGFGDGRTFSVSSSERGSVVLLEDGHTARFTADAGLAGLGSFRFTVQDGQSTFSDAVSVLIMDNEALAVTPNPMTWQQAPQSVGPIGITMTASPAQSLGQVEFFFECLTPGGHDSGWQDERTYTDWGLWPGTSYTYRVTARSKGSPDSQTEPSEPASATTAAMPNIPTPTAHWRFDETEGLIAHDVYGNSPGTIQGADAGIRQTGRFGNALHFNGAGARLYVPHTPAIDVDYQNQTVIFWLRDPPVRPEGQHIILVKGTYAAPDSGKRYEFYRKATASYDEFRFCVDDDVIKSEIAVPPEPFATGQWVCVAGVRDTAAQSLRLYADGRLIAATEDHTLNISQQEPMYIGDATWANAIDEVRIYKTALSEAQIQAIAVGADVPDVYPPRPDPMQWQQEPKAVGMSEVMMTAATAEDDSGVEYYFANLTDPAHDSGWQAEPQWLDTELTPNTLYTYRVQARDRSAAQNPTQWSAAASAQTPRFDCENYPAADLNLDCKVDLYELAVLAMHWGLDGQGPVDFNDDGQVDIGDLLVIALSWLDCGRLPVESCRQ
ncbi:MAG TPA: hypothetical protein ENN97_10410 [Phycisphaerales bacterium]|nr:hypothetical protein [Phycisphaerales bacterium]